METDCFTSACADLVDNLLVRYKNWEGSKQFKGTPSRLEKMYEEFCWKPEKIEAELKSQFRDFESLYKGMVVTPPINVWTLCPHHLLPCNFLVVIGCISDKKVLGLSKFARIGEILAKRPIMQEDYTLEVAKIFMEKLAPLGVAVYIRGSHGCMVSRGVKQKGWVTTSHVEGCFEELSSKTEFFSIAHNSILNGGF